MPNRTKLISVIALLTILSGVLGIIQSLPLASLYTSISQGGYTVVHQSQPFIIQVASDSPAQKAGLQIGDVLETINETPIHNSSEFIDNIRKYKDTIVQIGISRNGEKLKMSAESRRSPPPGQGAIGVQISDQKKEIIKKPLIVLIPTILLKSYAGYEEDYSSLISLTGGLPRNYTDHTYKRLRFLAESIVLIIIGIGLWKLKKWAWFGYNALIIIGILQTAWNIPNLLSQINRIDGPIGSFILRGPTWFEFYAIIIFTILYALSGYYIYLQKFRFH